MSRRSRLGLALLLFAVGLGAAAAIVAFVVQPQFPAAPAVGETLTPHTRPAPLELGSWDILGRTVSRSEAATLLATAEGRRLLSPANGAVAVTSELVALGRAAFYEETFGNEFVATEVAGALDGPINVWSVGRAVLALRGGHTTNLRIRLDRDWTIGGRRFPAGSFLDTGLDVPRGSLVPLGMRMRITGLSLRAGITCALCHAAVDEATGRVIEGAPNRDLAIGLVMAAAPNSTVFFRNTGADPKQIRPGGRRYLRADGHEEVLPDARSMEDAVDRDLLAWPPGSFDSTANLVNNPSQIPTSYTYGAWPYGWNGFASIGWFRGLTTLNNNVHALNADPTTGADASEPLLGLDKETYLGLLLQNAARRRYRLPDGARPSDFLACIDPTPGTPGTIEVVPMPDYPRGSLFIPDGLLASSPGRPFAAQLNGISAWQSTLAPPPGPGPEDRASLARGAGVFARAGCGACHAGRRFTNNAVVPQPQIGTQPSRARALRAFVKVFAPPRTYPPGLPVPLPHEAPVLAVPTDVTPEQGHRLAYGLVDGAGGYKVPSLLGLHVSAPYLHDGGVAVATDALGRDAGRAVVTDPMRLGLAGTLLRGVAPDAASSLRALVDRRLREAVVAANRRSASLAAAHVESIGHDYWVDPEGGFTMDEQDALIRFLLSLDDDPAVLP